MNEDSRQPSGELTYWQRKAERYIAAGQKARALRLLEKVIEYDMPLFHGDPKIQEERRIAWLYRIDLLREWGRYSEALAWTCLECELNPKNVAAHALKERLKKELSLVVDNRLFPEADVVRPSETKWSGVAGMREVKAVLERDVILPFQEPDVHIAFKVRPPNGVVFYGPPGCGKTHVARELAKILKVKFIEIKPSDLASTYVHGGQERIAALFDKARKTPPTVIFFDELDALVPKRGISGHHYSAEVNEFLVQLDGCGKFGLFVIGATNDLNKIDPAILRPGRIDKRVFIGPPDLEARMELLKYFMKDRPQERIDWISMAERSEYYTIAELGQVVDEAAKLAIQRKRTITQEDLIDAMQASPPRLTSEDVKRMRAPIGFV